MDQSEQKWTEVTQRTEMGRMNRIEPNRPIRNATLLNGSLAGIDARL